MRIGVVDSGIGGITTLKEIQDRVTATYYYYMDNVHVPYGSKSPYELLDIATNIMDNFMRVGVDIVVIACNTMSAVVGERLRQHYSVPIVCIEPSIMPARRVGGRSLILTTPLTANSMRIKMLIGEGNDMILKSSDHLATYIENGDMERAKYEVKSKLAGEIVDNVILGCTHYVWLSDYIASLGYRVFEGNSGVARRVEHIASNMGYDSEQYGGVQPYISVHSTAHMDMMRIARYIGMPIHLW